MKPSHPAADRDGAPPLRTLLGRALALRCPKCGGARLFAGWFAMHPRCAACGRKFDRAPGYFLGSIYFNYGVTALAMIVGYFAVFFTQGEVSRPWLGGLAAFCLLFPLWFFRYARALWIAFDERWDPWPNEDERRGEGGNG
ncbi:MAG TPA: DUF983 domain-containing protein [Lacipirellulaceae bacterium]|nr:DUF983 domain-containing protein [Lacipirellulaceae bacterium]